MQELAALKLPCRNDHSSSPCRRPWVWSRTFASGFVVAAVLAAICWAAIAWLVWG